MMEDLNLSGAAILTDVQAIQHRRQVAYWRLLAALFGYTEQTPNFEQMTAQVARELRLPEALLDPQMAIDTLLQRYPELESAFTLDISYGEPETATLRRALVGSKLLLNAFGPNAQTPTMGAA